ncbi:MAG: hypothetical protein J1F67_12040 [Muribaculaceae bacterium]|nr:hypothetical protein [Muribaculaceae bacterium]
MIVKQLIEKIITEIKDKRNNNQTFESFISERIGNYIEDVRKIEDLEFPFNKEKVVNKIIEAKEVIDGALREYSRANLIKSIEYIKEYVNNNNDNLLTWEISKDIILDQYWFRMRKQEDNHPVFPADQMFHIPFQLRTKVNTQRYSLPGYPCLYVSRSIWGCWEEMHEPKLSEFCVSCLKVVSNFTVLDLRIPRLNDILKDKVESTFCTLPFVIASSVPVLLPNDNFKPEYIIPQLLMLALVDNINIVGCSYTSTLRNDFFKWDLRLLDNIALPVQCVPTKEDKNEFCSKLTSYFTISDGTNYEYEAIREPFSTIFLKIMEKDGHCRDTGLEYPNSYFGQMEERLKANSNHFKHLDPTKKEINN